MKRRQFLKLLGGIGVICGSGMTIGCEMEKAAVPEEFPDIMKYGGNKPEAMIDTKTGQVTVDSDIVMRHSACLGCYSSCGNRVKVDKNTGKIINVYGNPYNPNNAFPHLDEEAPLTEAYLSFSSYQDKVNAQRGTICARGNATLESHYDPMRITVPLKRAGARGSGKWKPITWEELIEETVEGGKLFADIGEDYVIDGFRKVRDLGTLIDEKYPDLGPVANQLVFNGGRGDGRTSFGNRFTSSFGTVNTYSHGYS